MIVKPESSYYSFDNYNLSVATTLFIINFSNI